MLNNFTNKKNTLNTFFEEESRKKINQLIEEHITLFGPTKYAKKNQAPVSGKVIGKNEIINAVNACLDGWFTEGKYNKAFEKNMSSYLSKKYFLTCNSGSSANLLALSALCSEELGPRRLKKGDEVITCAMGFPTTINPILQNGLVPVFVDAKLENYNINERLLEKAISNKTKAIMIAHTLGNPFNVSAVKKFAEKYNLFLIEDCCDALGAEFEGQQVGSFGDIATLSFYPAHHITMGEGGGIFTQSSILKKIIQSIRDWGRDCWCDTGCDNTCKKRFDWKLGNLPHGYDHKYTYSNLGYNLKITDMQAAIGLAQYEKIDEFIKIRRKNFFILKNLLSDLSKYFILPKETPGSKPSWFGFPITIKKSSNINREKFLEYLETKKIGTRLLFGGNIIHQPYMLNKNYRVAGTLKVSDTIMKHSFWIGVYPGLKKRNLEYISKVFHDYFENN